MRYRIQKTTPERLPNVPIADYTVNDETDALNALIRECHSIMSEHRGAMPKVQLLDTDQGRIYGIGLADEQQTRYWLTANII